MAEATIRIEGVHPSVDGIYPVPKDLTNRDYSDIKRIAKLRAGEIQEAFEAGDMDLFVAFSAICLRRAGKPPADDALWDAPQGRITFVDGDTEEAEPRPPALTPTNGTPNGHVVGSTQGDPSMPSGPPSTNGTVHQESDPSPIGTQPSATGATSELATSPT